MSRFTGRRFQGIELGDTVTVNGRQTKVISGFGEYVADGNWFFDLFRFNKKARKTWATDSVETFQAEYNPAVINYTKAVIEGRLGYDQHLADLENQRREAQKRYDQAKSEFKTVLTSDRFDKTKQGVIRGYLMPTPTTVTVAYPEIAADINAALADTSIPLKRIKELRTLTKDIKYAMQHTDMLRKKFMLLDASVKRLQALPALERQFFNATQGSQVNLDDPYLNVYAAAHQIHPEYQHEFNHHEKLDHEGLTYGMRLLQGLSDVTLEYEQKFLDEQGDILSTPLTQEFKTEYGFYLANKKDEVKKEKQALAESAFNRVTGNALGKGLSEGLIDEYEKFIKSEGDFSVHLIERQDLPQVIEWLTAQINAIGEDQDRASGYPLTLLLRRLESHQNDLYARIDRAIQLKAIDHPSELASLWTDYNQNFDFSCLFESNASSVATTEAGKKFKICLEKAITSDKYKNNRLQCELFSQLIGYLDNGDKQNFDTAVLGNDDLDVLWKEHKQSIPLQNLLEDPISLRSFYAFLREKRKEVEVKLEKRKKQWASIFDFWPFKNPQKVYKEEIEGYKILERELAFSLELGHHQRNSKHIKLVSDHPLIKTFVKKANNSDVLRLYSSRLVFLLDDAKTGGNTRFFDDFCREYQAFITTSLRASRMEPTEITRKIKDFDLKDLNEPETRRYFFEHVEAMGSKVFADFLKDIRRDILNSTRAANGSDDLFVNYYRELGRIIKNSAPTLTDQMKWMRDDLEEDFFSLIAHSGVTTRNIDKFERTIALIKHYAKDNSEKLKLINFYESIINGDAFDQDTFNLEAKNVPADLSALGDGNLPFKLAQSGQTQNIMQVLVETFTKVRLEALKSQGATAVDFEGEKGEKLNTYLQLLGAYGKARDSDIDKGPAIRATKYFLNLLFRVPDTISDREIVTFIQLDDIDDTNKPCQALVRSLDPRFGLAGQSSLYLLDIDNVKLSETDSNASFPTNDAEMKTQLTLCFTSGYRDKLSLMVDSYLDGLGPTISQAANRIDPNNLLRCYKSLFNIIFSSDQKSRIATIYFEKLFSNDREVSLEGDEAALYDFYLLDKKSVQPAVSQVIERYIQRFPKSLFSNSLNRWIDYSASDAWWSSETAKTILKVGSNENIAIYTAQRIKEIFKIESTSPAEANFASLELLRILGDDGLARIRDYIVNQESRGSEDEITSLLINKLQSGWSEVRDLLCSTILDSTASQIELQNSRISKIGSLLDKSDVSLDVNVEAAAFIRYISDSKYKSVNFADSLIVDLDERSLKKLTETFNTFITNKLEPLSVVRFVADAASHTSLAHFRIDDIASYIRQIEAGIWLAAHFDAGKECLDKIVTNSLNLTLLSASLGSFFVDRAENNNYLNRDVASDAKTWRYLEAFLKSCLLYAPDSIPLTLSNLRPYNDVQGKSSLYMGMVIYRYLGYASQSSFDCADIYTISYIKYLLTQFQSTHEKGLVEIRNLFSDLERSYPAIADLRNRSESDRLLNEMLAVQFGYPVATVGSYQPGLYTFTKEKEEAAFRYGDGVTQRIALVARVAAIFDKAATFDPSDSQGDLEIRAEINAFKQYCRDRQLSIGSLKSYIQLVDGDGRPSSDGEDLMAYLRNMFDYHMRPNARWSPLIELLTNELLESDLIPSGSKHNREAQKDWLHLCRLKHLKEFYEVALDLETQRIIANEQKYLTDKQLEQKEPRKSYLEFQQVKVDEKVGLATSNGTLTLQNSQAYFGRDNVKKGRNQTLQQYGLESVEEILCRYIEGIQDTPTIPNNMLSHSESDYFALTNILAVQDNFTDPDYFRRKWETPSRNFTDKKTIAGKKRTFFVELGEGEFAKARNTYDDMLMLAGKGAYAYRNELARLASEWVLEFVREKIAFVSLNVAEFQEQLSPILSTALAAPVNGDYQQKLEQLNDVLTNLSLYDPLSVEVHYALGRIEDQKGYNRVIMLAEGQVPYSLKPKRNELILWKSNIKTPEGHTIEQVASFSWNGIGEVLSAEKLKHIPLPNPGHEFTDEHKVDAITEKFGLSRQKLTDKDFIITDEFRHKFKKSEKKAVSDRFSFYKALPDTLNMGMDFFDKTVFAIFNDSKKIDVLTKDDLKALFLPLMKDDDRNHYKEEIERVIESLSEDDLNHDVAYFTKNMQNDTRKEFRKEFIHGFYINVLKPRAEKQRFSPITAKLAEKTVAAEDALVNLINTPGLFFSKEDIAFYGTDTINKASFKVLELACDYSPRQRGVGTLKNFYLKLCEFKKKPILQKAHKTSADQENWEAMEKRIITAKDANSVSPADVWILLNYFSQLLIEKLADETLPLQGVLNPSLQGRLIQRIIAPLQHVNEKAAVVSLLCDMRNRPSMAPLLEDGYKARVGFLISNMDKINNLYERVLKNADSDNQIDCFTEDERNLIAEFDEKRKNALVGREGKLSIAIDKARNSKNNRRMYHLMALKDFIVSNGSQDKRNALTDETNKTQRYEEALAAINRIVAAIFSNSCAGLNLNSLLNELEVAMALNANDVIYWSSEDLKKYTYIAKIKGDFSVENNAVLHNIKDLILGTNVGLAEQSLMQSARVDETLKLMQDNLAIQFLDSELASFTTRQKNLYDMARCLGRLQQMKDQPGRVIWNSVELKEFITLFESGAASYLDFPIKKHVLAFASNTLIPFLNQRVAEELNEANMPLAEIDDENVGRFMTFCNSTKEELKAISSFLGRFALLSWDDLTEQLHAAISSAQRYNKDPYLQLHINKLKDVKGYIEFSASMSSLKKIKEDLDHGRILDGDDFTIRTLFCAAAEGVFSYCFSQKDSQPNLWITAKEVMLSIHGSLEAKKPGSDFSKDIAELIADKEMEMKGEAKLKTPQRRPEDSMSLASAATATPSGRSRVGSTRSTRSLLGFFSRSKSRKNTDRTPSTNTDPVGSSSLRGSLLAGKTPSASTSSDPHEEASSTRGSLTPSQGSGSSK